MVPGGFTGTPEIEEEGVESSDLSERGVKRNYIYIRRNKLIVIRESTNKPDELLNNSFQSGSCLSPGKSSNLKSFSINFRSATFKADIYGNGWM